MHTNVAVPKKLTPCPPIWLFAYLYVFLLLWIIFVYFNLCVYLYILKLYKQLTNLHKTKNMLNVKFIRFLTRNCSLHLYSNFLVTILYIVLLCWNSRYLNTKLFSESLYFFLSNLSDSRLFVYLFDVLFLFHE